MGWVQSIVSQAMANLVLDINGLTIRVQMLRQPSVPNGLPRDSLPVLGLGTASTPIAAPPPQQMRSCNLFVQGESVRTTAASFGATAAVGPPLTLARVALLCSPALANAPLRNSEATCGNIAVAERGGVSFVEKARRAQDAGAIALVVINSDEADFVLLAMETDPGDDIAIPVVCVRQSAKPLFAAPPAAGVSVTLELGELRVGASLVATTLGEPLPLRSGTPLETHVAGAASARAQHEATAAQPLPAATPPRGSTSPRSPQQRSAPKLGFGKADAVDPCCTLILVFDVIRSCDPLSCGHSTLLTITE
jgi:hypothetical protein